MSVLEGYLWELKKDFFKGWNEFSVISVSYFKSENNDMCMNTAHSIFIMEPIQNVNDETRKYVIDNIQNLTNKSIIFYEKNEWILKLQ